MLNDLKPLISRTGPTLVQDLAGALMLVVFAAAALHLPLT